MTMKTYSIVSLFCATLLVQPTTAQDLDVLIYGATPGGIASAVSAAKGGKEVLLKTRQEWIIEAYHKNVSN